MDDYPEANERHYAFMLEGLAEVARALRERGAALVVRHGSPEDVALELARSASVIVCDRGYLRHLRKWRENVASRARRRVVQVEADAVVPVESASSKLESAARTLRPKIRAQWRDHVGDLSQTRLKRKAPALDGDFDLSRPRKALERLRIDRSVAPVKRFHAGTTAARKTLRRFLSSHLKGYAAARNDPANPQCSNLSPYLHFGQISPVEVVRKTLAASAAAGADRAAFLEELVVRRELAINFVHYEPRYDAYAALPEWARRTLEKHRRDRRPHRYSRRELESAETHDPYWNAAMKEMLRTGYMHNYMRMYWGKKILEWSGTPQYAYSTTLYLNNKYFLDGRDPSSYANVGWIFGLHDRGWPEREIFGKVRYMNARGLERKFDIAAYVRWVEDLD
jgi:deoxyribodipyrimidine photo-lyase